MVDPTQRPLAGMLLPLSLAALGLAGTTGCLATDEPSHCGPGTTIHGEFEVVLSEVIPTVAFVRGSVDDTACTQAIVESGVPGALDHLQEVTLEDGELTATLLGLKAGTEYGVQVTVIGDGIEHAGDAMTFVTGDVPPSIPGVEVLEDTGEGQRPGFLVTSFIGEASTVVIIDRGGDLVWWHEVEDNITAVSRTALSLDGSSVLYLRELPKDEASDVKTELVRVRLDGTDIVRQPIVGGAHHDFVELPDGAVALLSRDVRDLDGVETVSDAVMELLPGGDVVQAWSAWDDFQPDPDWMDPLYDADMGWAHANALDYDADTDSYLVGLRNLAAVVAVSRGSGELTWQLGGDDSSYAFTGDPGQAFELQHQFQKLDGGMLVFDNGHPDGYESRAVEYALDEGEATVVWQHHAEPSLYCAVLGDVHRTAAGTTLVNWGSSGVLEEIAQDGEPSWTLALELGAGFGYMSPVDELPSP